MKETPPALSGVVPLSPPALDHLVGRCLEKNPYNRWQTARDVAAVLQWINQAVPEAASVHAGVGHHEKRSRLLWIAAVITSVLAIAGMAAALYLRPASTEPFEMRFQISTPSMPDDFSLALSPDGRTIAFVANKSASTALYIRPVGSVTPHEVPGTEGAIFPFWSPDSRSIGFFADDQLKAVDLSDGAVRDICPMPAGAGTGGASWSDSGSIIFGNPFMGGLKRVAAAGGTPVDITHVDQRQGGEALHLYPHFLPDGRHYLYTAISTQRSVIYLGALDSTDRTELLAANSLAIYAEPGYLLFQRGGTLFAQPFNDRTLKLSGEPVRIADVGSAEFGWAPFAVSRTGALVYRAMREATTNKQLLWFDPEGKPLGVAVEACNCGPGIELSPDGKHIALSLGDQLTVKTIISVLEWQRGVWTKLSEDAVLPVWSPEGNRVVFTSWQTGSADIRIKNANGTGDEKPIVESQVNEWAKDWSRDGEYIAYGHPEGDIVIHPLSADRKPYTIVKSNSNQPRFSDDGKWLAYTSRESGKWQVYVTSLPNADQKRQVSINGGVQPRWRGDGRGLYFVALDGKMMTVDVSRSSKLDSRPPGPLFDTGLMPDPFNSQYTVTSRGDRFLIMKTLGRDASAPITFVSNWTASLAKN